MAFKIDGVPIKNPRGGFKISRYLVTNMERLANVQMVGDLLARKKKFYFTYAEISGDDLDTIIDTLYESDTLWHTLTYNENDSGTEKTATVYVGEIPQELHHAGRTTNWVWKNVTFNLIER